MIAADHVSFTYPSVERKILDDVSFDLEQSRFLALLGNNGAGKNTLLRCLNRILTPKTGEIALEGKNLRMLKRREIAQAVSYVEQHNTVTDLTVFDAVLLGHKPFIRMAPEAEDYKIVEDVLTRLNLERFQPRRLGELSGGEFQKVMIARALAQKPRLLLLDEPTSNLDLHNQHEVMRIVRGITQSDGISAVVVIHDLMLAVQYCDRFLFLKNGQVYRYGDRTCLDAETIHQVYQVDAEVCEMDGRTVILVKES